MFISKLFSSASSSIHGVFIDLNHPINFASVEIIARAAALHLSDNNLQENAFRGQDDCAPMKLVTMTWRQHGPLPLHTWVPIYSKKEAPFLCNFKVSLAQLQVSLFDAKMSTHHSIFLLVNGVHHTFGTSWPYCYRPRRFGC